MSVTDSEVADRNLHRFVLLMGALAVLGEAAVAGIYLALPRLPIPDYLWIGGIMIAVTAGSSCYAWFLGYASSVSFDREGVEFGFRHRSSWVPWNAFSGNVRKGDWPRLLGRRYYFAVAAPWGTRTVTTTPRVAAAILSDAHSESWPISAETRQEVRSVYVVAGP